MKSRFLIPEYIIFSTILKVKHFILTLKHRGKSPYDSIRPLKPPSLIPVPHIRIDTYQALSHLDTAAAEHFYGDNPFITIRLIKALVYWNEKDRDNNKFISLVEKISLLFTESEGSYYYALNVPIKKYNLPQPWISGLVQGKMVSLLTRAYWLTQDDKYLQRAEKAINSIELPIAENGTLKELKQGMIWSEEYPDLDRPSMVLNGHLFTLIGLADYLTCKEDEEVSSLYDSLFSATVSYLPVYRTGDELLYSLADWKLCNVHYLCIMKPLTLHLARISGSEELLELHNWLQKKCPEALFKKLLKL